ncbi:MAG: ribonuclease III [Candidatus Levybacteria bacterium RIFOXYA1_FULL_41_10]|nr:MAG: Ribonuclease 3 [Candidatus Levybacteria bacterium GW2011_GWA1_39_32]KKR50134.1 MAG: Ribonuclease 3 [Candidatus Levybacteria bacterium GW2011_GWC1_40_19]KKR73135.1 MAG: Ribonuclease 3 [Candidatus Levybacteria bacterium GW2011_GWC2_40_7]KKR94981.1 MAG: Ribonuclease 3 [Candidatus Levybacteria bacterium GW2011_GWA2_41_15]OGH27678.1 MAG: ribonuclease III [Candidatus Levybacteria bacterium RIFCSPHIGHO2_02_FULL_40_29]OGH32786.1 MAG: ribonuclease III [Candidatus Levybacteria bacterium RIFCSPHI
MQNLPKFKNRNLLDEALTHRSYLNEIKRKVSSNERLEFLGDSVLSLLVSAYLFEKYPHLDEGKLTNLRSLLVNKKAFAQVADEMGLGAHLKLSKGEEESGGRHNLSLLADTFEALVGALFLDQGINAVSQFINPILFPKAEVFMQKNDLKDPKSLLQETIQSRKHDSPHYKVMSETGPSHAKTFTVGVFVNEKVLGEGKGKSKQEAEEKAAEEALKKFEA